MTLSVTKYCSVAVDDASAGVQAWTNPGNAIASDDAYATCAVNGESHYLKCTNFGFGIPSDATIVGVLVEVEAKVSSGFAQFSAANLVQLAGNGPDHDMTSQAGLAFIDTVMPIGGSADTWGLALSGADVNASAFGVRIQATTAGLRTVSVDAVRMTAYYTTGTNWIAARGAIASILAGVTIDTPIATSIAKVFQMDPDQVADWPCAIIMGYSLNVQRGNGKREKLYAVRLRVAVRDADVSRTQEILESLGEAAIDAFDMHTRLGLGGNYYALQGPNWEEPRQEKVGGAMASCIDGILFITLKDAVAFGA